MLQFWKKSGHKDKARTPTNRLCKSSSAETPSTSFKNADTKQFSRSFDSISVRRPQVTLLDDEDLQYIDDKEVKEQSKLCRNLSDVLLEKPALGYFIQYLEIHGGLQFVRCWLDIENFKSALMSYDSVEDHEKLSPVVSTKADHDSLSVSTDCDSYSNTGDTNSLCDCSTSTISEGKTNNSEAKYVHETDVTNTTTCDRSISDTSPKSNIVLVNNKANLKDDLLQEFVDDALRIFKKYVALEAPEPIKCPEPYRKEVIENICNDERMLKATCFEKVQTFVFDILEKDYFAAFLDSDYFCKYQIDILTSGNVVLEDILDNETALFYFMEFLEQENNRNLLDFWLAATNLHQQLRDQKEFFDPIEAQNDAVVLYDKYFSLQAHCPLGFGDKVRFAVEQNICGENGLMLDCFHLPLRIIERLLEKHYLKPFLASQLFYKYLSEMINAVQSNGYSTHFMRNGSLPSDCSSEKSFSTQSTFLAMEVPKVKEKRDPGTSMVIDTRELYDPDALWRRKKHHRLSVGRVTELGKFETDFEPEPDKKSQSKFRNVVKKFVNFDEDKAKEEMAWQVAEMIVKDITSVTLQDPKISFSNS